MKIKELSLEELEKEFSNFLNNLTDEELISSIEKYMNDSSKYSYIMNEKNNLEENIAFEQLNIIKDDIKVEKYEFVEESPTINEEFYKLEAAA